MIQALLEITTLLCVKAVCCVLSLLDEYQTLSSSSLGKKCFSKNRLSKEVSAQVTTVVIKSLGFLSEILTPSERYCRGADGGLLYIQNRLSLAVLNVQNPPQQISLKRYLSR